jgi:hypothetical protein
VTVAAVIDDEMRSWLAKKLGFLSNTRRVQHEVDATKVLLLSELYRRHTLAARHGGSGTDAEDKDGGAGAGRAPPQRLSIDGLLDSTFMKTGALADGGTRQTLREWLSSLSHEDTHVHARQNLHGQVLGLLQAVKSAHDKDVAAAAGAGHEQVHDFLVPGSGSATDPATVAAAEADRREAAGVYFKEQCGFWLETRESGTTPSRDESVEGVYIRGSVRAGAVLGFFPGVTFLRDRVHAGDFAKRMEERNGKSDLVFMRPDRSLIDGSQRAGVPNPFALGHLIRHPSGGPPPVTLLGRPNVLTFPFDFSNKVPEEAAAGVGQGVGEEEEEEEEQKEVAGMEGEEVRVEEVVENYANISLDPEITPELIRELRLHAELRPFIPNAYDTPPGVLSPDSAKDSFAQGAVIVALNDLEDGDELFCDYRLNPNLKNLPRWYVPVDETRDAILWG